MLRHTTASAVPSALARNRWRRSLAPTSNKGGSTGSGARKSVALRPKHSTQNEMVERHAKAAHFGGKERAAHSTNCQRTQQTDLLHHSLPPWTFPTPRP